MSARADRGERVNALLHAASRAEQLAAEAGSLHAPPEPVAFACRSIATSLAALVRGSVEDELKDYERDRDRERRFASELTRLAGAEGSALPPDVRTRRLHLLAQWLHEGYDDPPGDEDYERQRREAALYRGALGEEL